MCANYYWSQCNIWRTLTVNADQQTQLLWCRRDVMMLQCLDAMMSWCYDVVMLRCHDVTMSWLKPDAVQVGHNSETQLVWRRHDDVLQSSSAETDCSSFPSWRPRTLILQCASAYLGSTWSFPCSLWPSWPSWRRTCWSTCRLTGCKLRLNLWNRSLCLKNAKEGWDFRGSALLSYFFLRFITFGWWTPMEDMGVKMRR